MTTSQFVAKVILRATGKVSTSVSGDTKWTKVLAMANTEIDNWSNEPDIDWNSLYNPAFSITTVTATDTFAIPATVRKISQQEGDTIRIVHTDTTKWTDYTTIDHDQLKDFTSGNYVAKIGSNLKFNHTFKTTDPQFGGTIYAPVYLFAANISGDSDVIPVDIPNWLVLITAAEYIRNDVTRQNQYPTLIAQANEVMRRMQAENDGQDTSVYQNFRPMAQTWS